MKRLLFLKLGPYFNPEAVPSKEKYRLISGYYEGDILAVVNRKGFRNFNTDNFTLKGLYLPTRIRYINLLRNIIFSIFAIILSIYNHYFNKKYDAIIAYDPFATGLLAFIISKLIKIKFIVEVNGNYKAAFIADPKKIKFSEKLKKKIIMFIIPFVLKRTDRVKLLYENQLAPFNGLKLSKKVECFHDFVPISHFKPDIPSEAKYILFLGFPWFLKGVDILLKAFNKISNDYPEYYLKIVGYCNDKTYYQQLAENNQQIQLCNPVHYHEAIKLMEGCSLFILPSRTEAMGRVLLEAMASKKPIIACNVDGIPTYIKHGYNGLLFESENIDDLAEKMKTILGNEDYAKQIAENGYKYVYERLSEDCYVKKFRNMIEKTLND